VNGGAFAALARRRDWPYLNMADRLTAQCRRCSSFRWSRMAQPISTQQPMPGALRPARRLAPAMVVAGVALGVAILLGTLALWFHYGTAVFYEMIASGIAACF
jgi:hypothetical protein